MSPICNTLEIIISLMFWVQMHGIETWYQMYPSEAHVQYNHMHVSETSRTGWQSFLQNIHSRTSASERKHCWAFDAHVTLWCCHSTIDFQSPTHNVWSCIAMYWELTLKSSQMDRQTYIHTHRQPQYNSFATASRLN